MTHRLTLTLAAALASAAPLLAQAPAPPPGQGSPPPAVAAPPQVAAPGCGWDGSCATSGGQFWASADYVFGWIQGTGVPPLVTTSAPTTDRSIAGALGPQTATLFGGGVMNDALRPGMRYQAGYWFDPQRTFGVEAGFLMLSSQASLFSASSTGTPILARPFTDATTGAPAAALIAFPGSSGGSVDARVSSGNFYEAHLDLAENILDTGFFRLNGLVGYRFFRYDEGLRISQSINPSGGSFVPGTQIASYDNFATQNEFHGCDMGFRAQFFWEKVTVGLLAKVAVGAMRAGYATTGNTVTTVPGTAPVVSPGGVYALASNGGQGSSHDWGLVPELGINLNWQLTQHFGLQIGYSVLWLDRIARAADQVDTTINTGLLPPSTAANGDQRPSVLQERNHLVIQTLNLGMTFNF